MPDVYTIYTHGLVDTNRLKAAKRFLDVEAVWLIKPVSAQPGDTPVLAFQEAPDWVCDYALIGKNTRMESLADAILMCVGKMPFDRRMKTCEDVLSKMLGTRVKEIT